MTSFLLQKHENRCDFVLAVHVKLMYEMTINMCFILGVWAQDKMRVYEILHGISNYHRESRSPFLTNSIIQDLTADYHGDSTIRFKIETFITAFIKRSSSTPYFQTASSKRPLPLPLRLSTINLMRYPIGLV